MTSISSCISSVTSSGLSSMMSRRSSAASGSSVISLSIAEKRASSSSSVVEHLVGALLGSLTPAFGLSGSFKGSFLRNFTARSSDAVGLAAAAFAVFDDDSLDLALVDAPMPPFFFFSSAFRSSIMLKCFFSRLGTGFKSLLFPIPLRLCIRSTLPASIAPSGTPMGTVADDDRRPMGGAGGGGAGGLGGPGGGGGGGGILLSLWIHL